MRRPSPAILGSIALHAGVVALAFVSWPRERDEPKPLVSSVPVSIVSDIEMPAMDGYTLTTEIRRHPGLADLFVLLHTSLSGVFNTSMVQSVGANAFVAKYSPHELAEHVLKRLNEVAASAGGRRVA